VEEGRNRVNLIENTQNIDFLAQTHNFTGRFLKLTMEIAKIAINCLFSSISPTFLALFAPIISINQPTCVHYRSFLSTFQQLHSIYRIRIRHNPFDLRQISGFPVLSPHNNVLLVFMVHKVHCAVDSMADHAGNACFSSFKVGRRHCGLGSARDYCESGGGFG